MEYLYNYKLGKMLWQFSFQHSLNLLF